MTEKIVSLVPAEPGWRAYYTGEVPEDAEHARVVAWALVADESDNRHVVGLVISGGDPMEIVPAHEGAGALAPDFARYGFGRD